MKKKRNTYLSKDMGFQANAVLLRLGETKHIFSHVEWHMTGYRVILSDFSGFPDMQDFLPEGTRFSPTKKIRTECALPSAYRHYAKQLR